MRVADHQVQEVLRMASDRTKGGRSEVDLGGDGHSAVGTVAVERPASVVTVPMRTANLLMIAMFVFAFGAGFMLSYLMDRGFRPPAPETITYTAPAPGRIWVDTTVLAEQGMKKTWQIRWLEEFGGPKFVIVESDEARKRVEKWLQGTLK